MQISELESRKCCVRAFDLGESYLQVTAALMTSDPGQSNFQIRESHKSCPLKPKALSFTHPETSPNTSFCCGPSGRVSGQGDCGSQATGRKILYCISIVLHGVT